MDSLTGLYSSLPDLVPVLTVVVGATLLIWGVNRLVFARIKRLSDSRFSRQIATLGLGAVAIIAVILALPIGDETRGQLLSLLGLLLTAIIALSSTTLVSNAMAGFMLRAVRNFHPGDFIRVGEHFGRVTEQGLFHTEIQTGDRDLTTIPNAFLVSNPVTVVRHSGTISSAVVSIGYDVPHGQVESLLIEAAKKAELEEPFVQILELGNYAVTYRVAGFLSEIKRLLSARTSLKRCILDTLHAAGVEIASPTIMAQRPLDESTRLIPRRRPAPSKPRPEEPEPERIIFDKAEQAERLAQLRRERGELHEAIKAQESAIKDAASDARAEIESEMDALKARLERITLLLESGEEQGKG